MLHCKGAGYKWLASTVVASYPRAGNRSADLSKRGAERTRSVSASLRLHRSRLVSDVAVARFHSDSPRVSSISPFRHSASQPGPSQGGGRRLESQLCRKLDSHQTRRQGTSSPVLGPLDSEECIQGGYKARSCPTRFLVPQMWPRCGRLHIMSPERDGMTTVGLAREFGVR